jgi:hypothetical protein
VWAAIRYNPRKVAGRAVTYLGTKDGRYLQVEDDDGDRLAVVPFRVFATRSELVARHPELEVDPE